MSINSIKKIMVLLTIVSSFGLTPSSYVVNNAFSQAVPVPKAHTSNSVLDKSFSKSFSCLNSAIKSNQHVMGINSYFIHELTRNEMANCFDKTIKSLRVKKYGKLI